MLIGKPSWLHAVAGYIVVEAILITAAFGWVAIYSYALHRGESAAYYESYAQDASPVVALVAAMPVFYMTGLLMRRIAPDRAESTMLALVAISICVTIAILISLKEGRIYHWSLAILCGLAQLGAGWLGSRRSPRAQSKL